MDVEPDPDGRRASVPKPEVLPHYPWSCTAEAFQTAVEIPAIRNIPRKIACT
jgi:hypothetical protein